MLWGYALQAPRGGRHGQEGIGAVAGAWHGCGGPRQEGARRAGCSCAVRQNVPRGPAAAAAGAGRGAGGRRRGGAAEAGCGGAAAPCGARPQVISAEQARRYACSCRGGGRRWHRRDGAGGRHAPGAHRRAGPPITAAATVIGGLSGSGRSGTLAAGRRCPTAHHAQRQCLGARGAAPVGRQAAHVMWQLRAWQAGPQPAGGAVAHVREARRHMACWSSTPPAHRPPPATLTCHCQCPLPLFLQMISGRPRSGSEPPPRCTA